MRDSAIHIVRTLKEAGFQAVFAGGCVRDMIMGLEPHDYDIATSATPDEVESLFNHTIPVGKQFGIVVVVIDGEQFEVARFRKDSTDSDGRRPDSVVFSSMEEDAKRRDFTINGMFFDPTTDELFDFVGGQEDIKLGVIRFIGNAQDRINEDHLRLIRAIRFASRFGFDIEQKSIIKDNIQLLHTVSKERIKNEIEKTLISGREVGFRMLLDFGVFDVIIPEVSGLVGCKQSPEWHPEGDLDIHIELMFKNAVLDMDSNLAWSILFHDIAKPLTQTISEEGKIQTIGHEDLGAEIAERIMIGLKFSNDEIDEIKGSILNHMKIKHFHDMKRSKRNKIANLPFIDTLSKLNKTDILSASGVMVSIIAFEEFEKNEPKETRHINPIVNGKDLISIGFRSGPIFKEIIESVDDMFMDGVLGNKEECIEFINGNWCK